MSKRFLVEVALASLTACLFGLTLVWREWIELVFHIDPDGGNGSLEWVVVNVLFLATVVSSMLARAEWRLLAATDTQP